MGHAFHQSLAQGIALFNRREFYEAHEAWEAGWIDELSDARVLLQGLIQIDVLNPCGILLQSTLTPKIH